MTAAEMLDRLSKYRSSMTKQDALDYDNLVKKLKIGDVRYHDMRLLECLHVEYIGSLGLAA